jgi:hypothetical protein
MYSFLCKTIEVQWGWVKCPQSQRVVDDSLPKVFQIQNPQSIPWVNIEEHFIYCKVIKINFQNILVGYTNLNIFFLLQLSQHIFLCLSKPSKYFIHFSILFPIPVLHLIVRMCFVNIIHGVHLLFKKLQALYYLEKYLMF